MLLVGAVAIVARFFAMVRPVTVNSAPCNRPPVAFLGAAAILGLVAACAAVGVPHTNDPTEKLNYARLLLRDGRPLPAERLIGESLEIFQSRGDRGGVASAQHAYAWFLAGDHIEPLAGFYRKNGFRNSPANFDSRRQEAVKYFELAATGFAAAGKYADATNAYLDLAVTQSSDGNLGPACRAFSESLKSYYTYLKRDPNPEVRVPKGYISFEDFVITPAAVAGCPETQVGDKHKDPTEGTASDWHDRKLTLAEEVLALAHQSLGANHPATTEARKLLEHALRNARQSRPVASQEKSKTTQEKYEIVQEKTDLGMYGFLKIGKNEKQVRWRETVQLTPSDANSISDEGAYFEIHYNNRDFAGVRPVSPFANEILYRGSLVSRQENQLLDPLEIKPITTTVHLVLMPGKLEINIDADDSNQEARENNNGPFWITLDFRDFDRGR